PPPAPTAAADVDASPPPPPGWAAFTPPAADFTVFLPLPATPRETRETTGRQYTFETGRWLFTIAVTELAGAAYDRAPERHASGPDRVVTESDVITADGRRAHRVRIVFPADARAEETWVVPAGTRWVYHLGVSLDGGFDEPA